ncbi:MAG TPA: hypothetical protein DD381_13585 [Lentisphaeria bacterium]|nr:MAG: hypothetical protein A2X47_03890 [Lentisphaerae bacterium GWF2_38_69]HBM17354.1 hypothetical protein [Lentisphaeria bacterium]
MDIKKLFSENYIEAFDEGVSSFLVKNRNKNLGAMFASDRALFYIQILYGMLCLRRDHEIEPLNDDIYLTVKKAQENSSGCEYDNELFNHDMNQLLLWELVQRRIEKERLRGYRDSRRQKFRFRLTDETVSFLTWLEERLSSDIAEQTEDTANLLLDIVGRIKEIRRELERVTVDFSAENDIQLRSARTVVYNLSFIGKLTMSTTRQLTDLNAELLMFVVKNYTMEEAKKAIRILEFYSNAYLTQIYKLRKEIQEGLEQLIYSDSDISRINMCFKALNEEYAKMPMMLNNSRYEVQPFSTLKNTRDFYINNGKLDSLCDRINSSAMKVWGKLNAHLRELERRNTRIEDIGNRLKEFALLAEDETYPEFFMALLQGANIKYDPNYWDDHEKADPPIPKKTHRRYSKIPDTFTPKEVDPSIDSFVSIEQAKLLNLEKWIRETFPDEEFISVGKTLFQRESDFEKIVELFKTGYLGEGTKLRKINYQIRHENSLKEECVNIEGRSLAFNEFTLEKIKGNLNE